jgi:hypothetical protein
VVRVLQIKVEMVVRGLPQDRLHLGTIELVAQQRLIQLLVLPLVVPEAQGTPEVLVMLEPQGQWALHLLQ